MFLFRAALGILGHKDKDERAPQVVLVPPLFERDLRGRSRMAKSSYDYQFCKPQLRWLFNDYLWPCATSLLRFSPAEDRRVSVKARLGTSLNHFGADSHGAISIRFQPEPDEHLTFVDLKAAASTGAAQLRGCYFDTDSNLGAFARLPLSGDIGSAPDLEAGARYSTPEVSTGFICQPMSERLTHLWLVNQQGPFTLGWQLKPRTPLGGFMQNANIDFKNQLQAAHAHSSYALAYSPKQTATGGGAFTTVVELKEQRVLVVSLLHHMAVQRLCHNPFEEEGVIGIANYLDIGLQVVTELAGSPQASAPAEGRRGFAAGSQSTSAPDLCFAAQLQANKNVLMKARVGSQGVSAALAFKAWWQPSWTLAASWAWDFKAQKPRLGLAIHTENYGNIRYERSRAQRMGKALMQRHVALPEDIANRKGQGLLVDKAHLNDPATLGQVRRHSDTLL